MPVVRAPPGEAAGALVSGSVGPMSGFSRGFRGSLLLGRGGRGVGRASNDEAGELLCWAPTRLAVKP